MNELKSIHNNFTNTRNSDPMPIEISGTTVPYENNAQYLEIA